MSANLGYTFGDCALIIGLLAVSVTSTTACITLLLRRGAAKPAKPWLARMLREMQQADDASREKRLSPARFRLM